MCWSQWSTSCWACPHATNRLVLQAHGCWSFWQNQCPRNIFPLAKIYGAELECFSISLSADNQINHIFTGLPDYIIQDVTYWILSGPPRDATNLLKLCSWREWGIRESLIPLPPASVSSDKEWWSLLPGTLVLLVLYNILHIK